MAPSLFLPLFFARHSSALLLWPPILRPSPRPPRPLGRQIIASPAIAFELGQVVSGRRGAPHSTAAVLPCVLALGVALSTMGSANGAYIIILAVVKSVKFIPFVLLSCLQPAGHKNGVFALLIKLAHSHQNHPLD